VGEKLQKIRIDLKEGEMAGTGAKRARKLEERQDELELGRLTPTSDEVASNDQIPADSNLTEDERRQAARNALDASKADVDENEDEGDELRHTDEQIEQQDLNQGIDTGTHDSTRHGVDWGESYRARPTKGTKPQKKA
jgi:hypothetical protein